MKKLVYSLLLLTLPAITYSQEICDNGIDDDADGQIDLNDPDCACAGFGGGSTTVTSLIPNPSFEDYTCCPNSVSDLSCAVSWVQASNATSDYFNTCGYTGIFNDPDYPLPGGGAGYGGFYSNNNWEENIGACLNSPMTAGTSYTLDFNMAWSTGSTTLDVTLYGTPNCGDLPWNTQTCAVGSGSWMVLGTTTVTFPSNQSWQQVTITFTPTVDINAVSIGGPCGGQTSGSNYYFLDELTLATSASFAPGNITETGNWCSNDLLLTADPDTTGGTYQWYQGGVALAGETGATLDMMSYGAGDYSCVYTIGTDCIQMDYTLTLPVAPTSDFTFANQCDGAAVNFTDNSSIPAPGTITGYSWDFGDGNTSTNQNPSHTYSSDGTYTVSLEVTDDNGCTHTSTQDVTIYPNPVNDIEFVIGGVSSSTGLAGGCLVDPVSFTNNTSINTPDNIANWNWDFGDGTTSTAQNPPAHTYTTAGSYNITLNTTSNNGCTDNVSIPITIYPMPVADFTVTDNCLDDGAVFTNNSNIAAGTISSYAWDLGDGNTASAQNPPVHNYGADGTYTVELVVTSDQGCTDMMTANTVQFPEPVADFTMTSECIVDASIITNNSTVNAPDNITIWSWDFDDGNTSAVQDPGTHTYAVESTYDVMLAVETNNGCQDTLIVPVTVDPSPIAAFTASDDCLGQGVTINNTSNISSGSIATWEWDFGDGNTSAVQTPSHSYATSGTYTIELVVTSDQGCTDTVTATTTRFPIPQPDFTVAEVCEYEQITATDNSTIAAPDNIASFEWQFGDGNTGTGTTVNHLYSTYGTYTVNLTTTSNNGCTASTTNDVLIHAQPQADFTASTVCINTPPTVFTDQSTIGAGNISSWDWDFGDGTFGSGQGTTHGYGAAGNYPTELLVTSDFGCVDSATVNAIVNEKPTAAFTSNVTQICSPDQIMFEDISTGASPVVQWEWDFFGAAGSTTDANPAAYYTNDGSSPELYDVELIVTNSLGCKDTVYSADYITVYPTPQAIFSANPSVLDLFEPTTQFNNSSINSNEWEWNFGDGSPISLQENPEHTYPNVEPGTYNVQLIAYNWGKFCSDTARGIIEVQDVIIFYVPNIFTPDGDEFNETWKPVFYSGHDIYDFHMVLYNRWGEVIWESYDASVAWDGHYGDGGLVEDGVYIWQVDFKETMSDKRHSHRGHVTVLK